jgi:hypothetical protein
VAAAPPAVRHHDATIGRAEAHSDLSEASRPRASGNAQVFLAVVRRQFRDCAGLQRYRQVIDALNQGYEVIEHTQTVAESSILAS